MIHHTLADVIFWIATMSCIVAQIAILRSALAAPLVSPSDSKFPMPRRWVEVAWTMVPAIALTVLLAFTWKSVHDRRGSTGGPPPAYVERTP